MFVYFILSLLSLVSVSVQKKDPLKDFCRIFGHQTAIVDRKLYVDGGLVNFAPLSADSLNRSSAWLREGDLDVYNYGFPQQTIIEKNETVPSVHGGVLWPDEANKLVYMYGGEFNNDQPEDFQLWYYDIVYGTWNVSSASTVSIQRAAWGAGATAQDKGLGYYYGGYLTNSSVLGYEAQTPLANMLVYDMYENSFRNQSGPDAVPRAEGVMQYVPVGDAGMLVYFGGIEFPDGSLTGQGSNMSEIMVYSIGDHQWYRQKAVGDVPENRRRFCAGTVWAEDRSSYNIYLYGGASIDQGVGFDDVYILSLPSFTWIKFWPDSTGASSPHHSLTCDIVGGQMIIMGGHFPNKTSDCDGPMAYGQHGLDLGRANSEGVPWASYNASLTTYQVPIDIAEIIGGGPTGGATRLAPPAGFQEEDLRIQFSRTYTPGVRSPTRIIPTAPAVVRAPTSQKKSNKKATIGGAVGGALGVISLVSGLAIFIFLRRRKPQDKQSPPPELSSISSPNGLKSSASSSSSDNSPLTTYHNHSPQGPPPTATENDWTRWNRQPPDYSGHTPSNSPPRDGGPLAAQSRQPHELGTSEPQEMPAEPSLVMTKAQENARLQLRVGTHPYYQQHPPRPPREPIRLLPRPVPPRKD